jgi:acetyl coenzyme A synthetase (ADP forming)-like protein
MTAERPAPAYPAYREADVVLRDGSTVHVRPLRPDDEQALRTFLEQLSPDSQILRFFSAGVNLGGQARLAAQVDYTHTYGVIATTGRDAHVVGHAGYASVAGDSKAEVAFAIADSLQGKGLATIMLAHLAEAAGDAGIETFEAEVLPQNHRMLAVFRQSGLATQTRSGDGVVTVEFPASLSPSALERFELRDRTAAVAALRRFLAPASVAVIGASRRRGSVGGEIFRNMLDAGFAGPVYPVNPTAGTVQSVLAYPSVLEVPGEVDLAVVVVPAAQVCEVARQCARKGVKGLVVISAGFGETGEEGAELQRELLAICRESGMRLIGPNTMGILNTNPGVSLNAQFGPVFPPRGRVGFLSQSGALGLAVIDHAARLGLGLSSFVSVGNKADISGNDLIHYWEEDPDTDVMLLYLESFGNPRRFARIARRAAHSKPIVCVKSGRSSAGARATASHTGALLAASDVTVEALFRQAGVIRTDTLSELFDVASLLAAAPVPGGRRVGVVTNAGGPGVMTADAIDRAGLRLATLSDASITQLRGGLPEAASVSNPIDVLGDAPSGRYQFAIEVALADPVVDGVIVLLTPQAVTEPEATSRVIANLARMHEKPIVAVYMGGDAVARGRIMLDTSEVPAYHYPERAVRAMAALERYGRYLHDA